MQACLIWKQNTSMVLKVELTCSSNIESSLHFLILSFPDYLLSVKHMSFIKYCQNFVMLLNVFRNNTPDSGMVFLTI